MVNFWLCPLKVEHKNNLRFHAKHSPRKSITISTRFCSKKKKIHCCILSKEWYSELKSVKIVVADNTLTRLLSHISFIVYFVSYTQSVVGIGIKAQSGNPEVKVKGTDPVINQIIDKLKHVIQVSSGLLIGILSGK